MPWKGEGFRDFAARDGAVFVLPYATNLAYTHEVPHSAASRGRRISITLRGASIFSCDRMRPRGSLER
jgi:hypothetical protein